MCVCVGEGWPREQVLWRPPPTQLFIGPVRKRISTDRCDADAERPLSISWHVNGRRWNEVMWAVSGFEKRLHWALNGGAFGRRKKERASWWLVFGVWARFATTQWRRLLGQRRQPSNRGRRSCEPRRRRWWVAGWGGRRAGPGGSQSASTLGRRWPNGLGGGWPTAPLDPIGATRWPGPAVVMATGANCWRPLLSRGGPAGPRVAGVTRRSARLTLRRSPVWPLASSVEPRPTEPELWRSLLASWTLPAVRPRCPHARLRLLSATACASPPAELTCKVASRFDSWAAFASFLCGPVLVHLWPVRCLGRFVVRRVSCPRSAGRHCVPHFWNIRRNRSMFLPIGVVLFYSSVCRIRCLFSCRYRRLNERPARHSWSTWLIINLVLSNGSIYLWFLVPSFELHTCWHEYPFQRPWHFGYGWIPVNWAQFYDNRWLA